MRTAGLGIAILVVVGGCLGGPGTDPGTPGPTDRSRLSTGGSVADGELTVRVTRDRPPANVTLTVVGATDSRYHTGADGLVALDIVSSEIVEIEAAVDGPRP